MKDLQLEEAIRIAGSIRTGESLPSLGTNVIFNPRSAVKYLSGLDSQIEQTQLVLQKNASAVGVRNIDKNMLEFPFLVTGIRMIFDTTSGAGVTPQTANYKDNAPKYWKNGELAISQEKLLSKLPVSVLANSYAATNNNDGVFQVSPFMLREGKAFEIQALLTDAVVANNVFRLELIGIEFQINQSATASARTSC